MRQSAEYQILDNVTPVVVTSSTDATPIVVTATSHGFATGDKVMINGHTTNIAANGLYKVTKVNANSFSLQNINTGANIAGSGAGAGSSGVVIAAPKIPMLGDFKDVQLQFFTSGGGNMTVRVAGSLGLPFSLRTSHGDTPNFGATISSSNPYEYIAIINQANGATTPGATGIVLTGTDVANSYKVNIDGIKYLTLICAAWSAGAISAKLIGYYE